MTHETDDRKYPSKEVKAAARQAAASLQTTAPPKDAEWIVTNDELLAAAAVKGIAPPPDVAPKADHDEWNMAWMSFREEWREEVAKLMGRWPKTAHGTGFKVLRPNENAGEAEDQAYDAIKKGIKKGKFILKQTRDEDLTPEERQQKADASVRLGTVKGAVRTAESEQKAQDAFKDRALQGRPNYPGPIERDEKDENEWRQDPPPTSP